mmetsp:Transcript_24473/g.52738  ORF Transcript_24473/g.52738 Transcript_24473/m.52738 type:complete len:214 (+) Transcript_24473:91-732(+)
MVLQSNSFDLGIEGTFIYNDPNTLFSRLQLGERGTFTLCQFTICGAVDDLFFPERIFDFDRITNNLATSVMTQYTPAAQTVSYIAIRIIAIIVHYVIPHTLHLDTVSGNFTIRGGTLRCMAKEDKTLSHSLCGDCLFCSSCIVGVVWFSHRDCRACIFAWFLRHSLHLLLFFDSVVNVPIKCGIFVYNSFFIVILICHYGFSVTTTTFVNFLS